MPGARSTVSTLVTDASLRVDSASDYPTPNNPYQSVQFQRCVMSINVGYVQSAGLVGYVDAVGTETAATEVARADRRALSDAMRIKRALEFGPLRGVDTDPVMVEVTRLDATNVDLGGGRLVCTSRFTLVIQYDATRAYGP